MKEEELRELFCAKIGLELEYFKKRMLKRQPEFIYQNAYKIDCMISIYETLLELNTELSAETLQMLVVFPNILTFFYHKWLKWDDSASKELENCLNNTILNMTRMYVQDDNEKNKIIAA